MDHSSGLESVRPFSATSNAALSVRERRLGLANRLLDRYHASLHSEVVLLSYSLLWVAVNSNPGSSAFPSKGEGDRIGSAMPSSTWNANPSPTVSARAWIYIVCSTASQSRIGFRRLSLVVLIHARKCSRGICGRRPLWLLSRLVLIHKPPDGLTIIQCCTLRTTTTLRGIFYRAPLSEWKVPQ